MTSIQTETVPEIWYCPNLDSGRAESPVPPHRPFPLPPEKPYIPFHKRLPIGVKAMTMVAGFGCKDGVVLCADTEMTMPGWIKFPGSKIRLYPKLKCRAAFTFAGDKRFCEMFMRKLVVRIHSAENEGIDLLASIEDEALSIHKKFAGEQCEAESALILSLWRGAEGDKKRRLYSIAGGTVNSESLVCEGTGTLVTRGMITELFSTDMSMKRAALLTIYMLAEAKAYGYGVGKDSQVLLLGHDGSWCPFPEDPHYSTVKEVEEDYLHLKRLLRPIVVAYSDIAIDENAFSAILQDFTKHAAFRRKARRAAYERMIEHDFESQIAWAEESQEEDAQ